MTKEGKIVTQQSLFGELPEQPAKGNSVPPLDRFQGAMLFSAVGDALGWPTEFLQPDSKRTPPFEIPVQDFVQWKKLVGGRWWGYEQKIGPGEYSDDTQLTLAISRCITEKGVFEPEKFAYEELPLWLQYERGGGKSIKTAARKLIGKNANWQRNFYKQGELDYRGAGANGAAMRNLPIALVNVNDESQLIRDSFLNAIITHGHPRAILGAILFGLAVKYVLSTSQGITYESFVEYLCSGMMEVGKVATHDEQITSWIQAWENNGHEEKSTFGAAFNKVHQEALNDLRGMHQYVNAEPKAYYNFVGALSSATKGSGLATVCAAIYMFLRYIDQPEEALATAVNTFGSDTDTIGLFVGALLGAYHGIKAVPLHLSNKVQDRDYLLKTAKRLRAIASEGQSGVLFESKSVERQDAYFMILAWEIGLHEMFRDDIEVGGVLVHPTLGRGKIVDKEVKPIKRDGYVAKLIHMKFDCGQSCVFHSRVENNAKVSESLAQDVANALS